MPWDYRVPEHLSGTTDWRVLREEVTAFCERTNTELEAELAKHGHDAPERDVIVGAMEFCAQVPALLMSHLICEPPGVPSRERTAACH